MPDVGETVAIVPDAVFGIEYQDANRKLYRFFALEADRGTMPIVRSKGHQTSYLGKITAYHEILAHQVYKTQLGLPNLLVLTVTTSEPRKSEIMRRLEEQAGDGAAFLFKAIGSTVTPAHSITRRTVGASWTPTAAGQWRKLTGHTRSVFLVLSKQTTQPWSARRQPLAVSRNMR